jgi:hypothetical protein
VPRDEIVQAINEYCARLRKALHKVPFPERDEIVKAYGFQDSRSLQSELADIVELCSRGCGW